MSMSLPALAARVDEGFTEISASDFDQIVQQHQRRIFRMLLLMVRNPEDADNLTQECFLRAYTSRERFRGACSVQTWLLRIAVNLARDHIRNRRAGFWKRLLRIEDESFAAVYEAPCELPSPERGLIAREKLDAVWRVVDELSARQKEVFLLRFVEEMDLKEIADVLNLRTGTVKAQLFRAIARVREQVQW